MGNFWYLVDTLLTASQEWLCSKDLVTYRDRDSLLYYSDNTSNMKFLANQISYELLINVMFYQHKFIFESFEQYTKKNLNIAIHEPNEASGLSFLANEGAPSMYVRQC
jgi:hypothetical protein